MIPTHLHSENVSDTSTLSFDFLLVCSRVSLTVLKISLLLHSSSIEPTICTCIAKQSPRRTAVGLPEHKSNNCYSSDWSYFYLLFPRGAGGSNICYFCEFGSRPRAVFLASLGQNITAKFFCLLTVCYFRIKFMTELLNEELISIGI